MASSPNYSVLSLGSNFSWVWSPTLHHWKGRTVLISLSAAGDSSACCLLLAPQNHCNKLSFVVNYCQYIINFNDYNHNFGPKRHSWIQLTQLPLVHFYRWFCIERFSWLENQPAYAWDCVLGSYVSVLRYLVPFWFYRLFCRYRKASKSKIIHNIAPTQQNQKPMRTTLATKQLIRLAKFEILESIPGKMSG